MIKGTPTMMLDEARRMVVRTASVSKSPDPKRVSKHTKTMMQCTGGVEPHHCTVVAVAAPEVQTITTQNGKSKILGSVQCSDNSGVEKAGDVGDISRVPYWGRSSRVWYMTHMA